MSDIEHFISDLDEKNDRPVSDFWNKVSGPEPTVGVDYAGQVLFSWWLEDLYVECELFDDGDFQVFYEVEGDTDIEKFSNIESAASRVNTILKD